MIDFLKDIWQGYVGSGLLNTSRPIALVIDLALAGVALYYLLQILNNRRGWRYLLLLSAGLASLIVAAYFDLDGLHLLSRAFLLILVIALPVLFHQEWSELLSRTAPVNTAPVAPVLSRSSLIGLSLVLAIALVLLGNGVTNKTAELPQGIPIEALNLADGLSAKLGSERKVQIIVSAPRQTWQTLTEDSFSATVDVAKQGEGTYDLPIMVTSKVSGVEVRRVKPTRLSVTVEPVIRKTVPIVAKFSGKAGNDLVADTPTFNPEKVEITGPKSVVTDLTQVIANVKLNGETGPLDQKITLVVQDSSGEVIQGVTVNPESVNLKVNLVKAGKLKTVGIVPVITGTPKAGLWVKGISVTPGVVTLTGPVDELEKITQISTAPVSVNGLDSDTESKATLSFPSGITAADDIKTVTIKISLTTSSTIKSITPQLVYANLSPALQVTSTNPTSIIAIISGPTDKLAALADGDVKINLELSAYKSAGNYSLTIRNADFVLPDGVSLVSFLPSAIGVTLADR